MSDRVELDMGFKVWPFRTLGAHSLKMRASLGDWVYLEESLSVQYEKSNGLNQMGFSVATCDFGLLLQENKATLDKHLSLRFH